MSSLGRAGARAIALVTSLSVLAASVPALAQQPATAATTSTLPPLPSTPAPPASPAPAGLPPPTAAGEDVVVLRDGGMLRGALVEVLPNDHVTVQLATGQVAIVQWGQIARIERRGGGAAPPPPPPPYAPGGRPVPPGFVSGGTVLVHLESDAPVNLEQRGGAGYEWRVACTAPCDRPLPTNFEYRITGDGVRTSRPFGLEAQAGERLVIAVSPRSSGGRTTGLVMTIVGGLVLVASLVVFVDAASKQASEDDSAILSNRAANDVSSNENAAGLILLVVGAAVTAVGIVVFARNSSTKVAQRITGGANGGPLVGFDVPTRQPVWHEASPGLPRPQRPMTFPLFTASF